MQNAKWIYVTSGQTSTLPPQTHFIIDQPTPTAPIEEFHLSLPRYALAFVLLTLNGDNCTGIKLVNSIINWLPFPLLALQCTALDVPVLCDILWRTTNNYT